MAAVHRALAGVFALLLDPFAALPPLIGLMLISAASGVLLLIAFRFTSNPSAIRAARQKVQAHLLAVRLYRDDLTVVFRAQGAFLLALLRYLGLMAVPFMAVLLPFALLFAHLDARYGTRALHPGERAIVKAIVANGPLDGWRLDGAGGVVLDSPPVHISVRHEIDWRVRAEAPGHTTVVVVRGDQRVAKGVDVTSNDEGAAPRRSTASVEGLFLAPTDAPIEPSTGIESIEITYPPMRFAAAGWHVHWIVVFLIVSAAVAWLLRKRAGVEF